jgi:hypothetical protein
VKPFARKLIAAGRSFGPYLAIELVMPGGSLLAVLLWLYRTSSRPSGGAVDGQRFNPSLPGESS